MALSYQIDKVANGFVIAPRDSYYGSVPASARILIAKDINETMEIIHGLDWEPEINPNQQENQLGQGSAKISGLATSRAYL